jgi:PIN domain nuclease of toxin-antitoxin system
MTRSASSGSRPISVWELGMLEERGRVRLVPGNRARVEEAFRRLPLEEASLTKVLAPMPPFVSQDSRRRPPTIPRGRPER